LFTGGIRRRLAAPPDRGNQGQTAHAIKRPSPTSRRMWARRLVRTGRKS